MRILTQENPRLRIKARSVNPQDNALKRLIAALIATVTAQQDPEGVGLAAPQIGAPARVFVAKVGQRFIPFINPKIIEKGAEEAVALEGCLSVPRLYGEVRRPRHIRVQYITKTGKPVVRSFFGLAARIIQHETDHLDGILFLDHVKKQSGQLFWYQGKDSDGKEIFTLVEKG